MSLHINNNGIGKKLLLAPLYWKSTWTWSPVTSTELPGANHMVTTSIPPVLSRKLLPTQIFQYLPAPHRCGAQGQCQVNRPMCVVLSNTRTRMTNGRFVYMVPSQFPSRPSAFVQKIEVVTMMYGCTWTLLAIKMAHEPRGNHEQRVLLKERSCPYPPNKERQIRR